MHTFVVALLRMSDWLAWPCRVVARVAGWGLLFLTTVILYDVIGRRFFATGSFVLQELEWHIHGAIALAAFGYAYLHDVHVRIDVFATRMAEQSRLRLELAAILLFLVPFMLFVAWYGFDFAHRAWVRGEGSMGGMGVEKRWIIKGAIPAAAVLAILGGLSVAARIVVALRRPDLLSTPFRP